MPEKRDPSTSLLGTYLKKKSGYMLVMVMMMMIMMLMILCKTLLSFQSIGPLGRCFL